MEKDILMKQEIHSSAKVHPTTVIIGNVKIGQNVEIGPYCIIGAKAESIKHLKDEGAGVVIEDGAIITGLCTIDAGVERPTTIGVDAFIMKGVHIGHACIVGHDCLLSPHVVLCGYVELRSQCNMGMASVIHQRVVVPTGCMVGMNTTITKSTELNPWSTYVGSPARLLGPNKKRPH